MNTTQAERTLGIPAPHSSRRPMAALPTVAEVDQLPASALLAFVAECTALQAYAAARLGQQQANQGAATTAPVADAARDRRVRAPEAAKILGCGVRWLRQHGHKLPSYRRDMNGRRVTWLASALGSVDPAGRFVVESAS